MTAALPPRVGVTTYRESARWGVWDEPADLLPASYADAVARAGGVALLLPPARVGAAIDVRAGADRVLDGVDGLVLAGGPDVDPARYGAASHPATGLPRRDRDDWEIALVAAAFAVRVPVLAVCRGLQVLNVACGGSLVQHVPELVGSDEHCPTPGRHGRHGVRIDPASRLGALLGSGADVATYHHQAVDRLGSGLRATAWADDGLVEAVELDPAADTPTATAPGVDGAPWVVGVQWHPEVGAAPDAAGEALFAGFVAACQAGVRVPRTDMPHPVGRQG